LSRNPSRDTSYVAAECGVEGGGKELKALITLRRCKGDSLTTEKLWGHVDLIQKSRGRGPELRVWIVRWGGRTQNGFFAREEKKKKEKGQKSEREEGDEADERGDRRTKRMG